MPSSETSALPTEAPIVAQPDSSVVTVTATPATQIETAPVSNESILPSAAALFVIAAVLVFAGIKLMGYLKRTGSIR